MFFPISPSPPSGMMRILTLSSWQQSVAVTWEERCLADVRETERLRHEPAEPEREAAVRRHPVPEGVEIAGERRLVEAARRERRAVVLIAMEPLAARDDLQAAVEEVEAARSCRFRRVRVRVEGSLRHRAAVDE